MEGFGGRVTLVQVFRKVVFEIPFKWRTERQKVSHVKSRPTAFLAEGTMVHVLRQELVWNIWKEEEDKDGREWKEMRPKRQGHSYNLHSPDKELWLHSKCDGAIRLF